MTICEAIKMRLVAAVTHYSHSLREETILKQTKRVETSLLSCNGQDANQDPHIICVFLFLRAFEICAQYLLKAVINE